MSISIKTPKILHIDGDEAFLAFFQSRFEDNLEIHSNNDIVCALKEIRPGIFDLVIMDYKPEMDLFKIVNEIQLMAPGIPVVLKKSASNGKPVEKASFYLGNSSFITVDLENPEHRRKFIRLINELVAEKNMEKELKEAWERVKLLREVIEQADNSIMITDSDAKIIYVNPLVEKLSGYTYRELIGKTPSILKSGRHDREFYHHMWDLIKSGGSWKGVLVNKKKDGTFYKEYATIFGVKDPHGKVKNFAMISGNMHDAAMERTDDSTEETPDMERVCKESVNGLTTEEIPEDTPRANPNNIVEDMKMMPHRVFGENTVLNIRIRPDVPDARIHQDYLEEIVMNLMVNAGDAMPDGGTLTVSTDMEYIDKNHAHNLFPLKEGGYVTIEVCDTGTGMDSETVSRLFTPSFTTKDKEKRKGQGLSRIYELIKESGGDIQIVSIPGKGSTFKVFLPSIKDKAGTNILKKETPSGSRARTKTIMVVEDEQSIRKLLKKTLEMQGYDAEFASTGDEALALCKNRKAPPDLIIADMILPDADGWNLSLNIKKKFPGTRILLMSGYVKKLTASHLAEDKDVKFLSKPFNVKDLVSSVKEILEK